MSAEGERVDDQRLTFLVFRDSSKNVSKRLQAALSGNSSHPAATEAYCVSFALEDLNASVLDRLAALIGWEAVDRLNVGAVADALATGDLNRDASVLPPHVVAPQPPLTPDRAGPSDSGSTPDQVAEDESHGPAPLTPDPEWEWDFKQEC